MAHLPNRISPTVGVPANEDEFKRLGDILSDVFDFSPELAKPYFESAGLDNVRLVRAGGEIAGGMALLPAGQWFGGKSVPMVGIAAVAIAPQFRSCGMATAMLRSTLEDLHARGRPLSTLYPATVPVYRKLGYETAGMQFEASLPTRSIGLCDRDLEMRPATPADREEIKELYRCWASAGCGHVDRTDFFWNRVEKVRGQQAQGYVACRDGRIEGWLYLLKKRNRSDDRILHLTDFVATTAKSGRRMLTFLAEHRSVVKRVSWSAGPADPLLTLLDEKGAAVQSQTFWMLRIVHAPSALQLRGYAQNVSCEIAFQIHDDLLPGNNGRYVLSVRQGKAKLEPGGRGSFQIDIRGLAALYTGYLSPAQLVVAGYLAAPQADLEAAAGLFAGPAPWMSDKF